MKENLFIDASLENKKENITIKSNKKFKLTYYKEDNEYYTLNFDNALEPSLIKETIKIITSLLKKYHSTYKTLIIGLGNEKIIGDSLGKETLDKIIATNQYDFLTIPKVALFKPSVVNNTGIDSFRLIKMVVNSLKPDVIILIDSCITKNANYLNKTIEINDAGIIRSSAISSNKEITKETFNIPIIAILVPLIIKFDDQFYTAIDAHENISNISNIISKALNKIYFQ